MFRWHKAKRTFSKYEADVFFFFHFLFSTEPAQQTSVGSHDANDRTDKDEKTLNQMLLCAY